MRIIWKILFRKLFQCTALEIQIRSVKCTVYTSIRKNFEHSHKNIICLFLKIFFFNVTSCDSASRNFSFLSKWYKTIAVCSCKQTTSTSFQKCLYLIYLFKLYKKPVIILLAKELTNICSEISEIRMILWMVYTCNVKRLEQVETLGRNVCTLHRWPRSLKMSDCSRPYQ